MQDLPVFDARKDQAAWACTTQDWKTLAAREGVAAAPNLTNPADFD